MNDSFSDYGTVLGITPMGSSKCFFLFCFPYLFLIFEARNQVRESELQTLRFCFNSGHIVFCFFPPDVQRIQIEFCVLARQGLLRVLASIFADCGWLRRTSLC